LIVFLFNEGFLGNYLMNLIIYFKWFNEFRK